MKNEKIQTEQKLDNYKHQLIVKYSFNDKEKIGKNDLNLNYEAKVMGTKPPRIVELDGRSALQFMGGSYGSSYLQLPEDILSNVDDMTGLTISAWIYLEKGKSVWERIFDFGKGEQRSYLFLTRGFRGVCFYNSDLAADSNKTYPLNEWIHVAMTVTGTKGGTMSNAGPCIYINGELVADGLISQTSSGTYKQLRAWFDTLKDTQNYTKNYIGHSQYEADEDFTGAISDFRIYKTSLTAREILEVMCETLTDEQIVKLVLTDFLPNLPKIVTQDLELPTSFLNQEAEVKWVSDKETILHSDGTIGEVLEPESVLFTAYIKKGICKAEKSYLLSVIPKEIPPYEITIHGDSKVLKISDTLYGLFYEDINNAADGGLYAEMISNRSFEAFEYNIYDSRSGENACSAGRNHTPLLYWYGDLDKVTVKNQGGLHDFFHLKDKDTNTMYVTVEPMTRLYNRGFVDKNEQHAMYFKQGVNYEFSIWVKPETLLSIQSEEKMNNLKEEKNYSKEEKNNPKGEKNNPKKEIDSLKEKIINSEEERTNSKKERIRKEQSALIKIELQDKLGNPISQEVELVIEQQEEWKKYTGIILTPTTTCFGQIALLFTQAMSIDMLSLMPGDVWGAAVEESSKTAHINYMSNPNYRLRKDLVLAMKELHPKFLRFPGGCISEGSYIWDNVYDWKDSVGSVEVRKENFNVWGYMMTLGLGYMEYFQLAEDLHAEPLPVMACGVLCQARSDYANPAGGSLKEKYIKNFTDLIDFAINTNTSENEWATLRKQMGHEEPFPLHYLGVGNENWGEEFFASFEQFKYTIDTYMNENYKGYPLTIISTVGAQADDDAYQEGWRYLSGHRPGSGTVRFTDGNKSFDETVQWYQHQENFMDTIVDEHYYRSNEYLLENADRYNYYYRAYKEDGTLDEAQTSKVFVGEYASNDKNTLAGAIAEAAVMTGFENNSDVVRLAATAPLFNKVVTDGTYRWTPDAIWFDNETVWRTPNYYIQQMFAGYIGTYLLQTTFETYFQGKKEILRPRGGISISTKEADLLIKEVKVISNEKDHEILFYQDFTKEQKPEWNRLPESSGDIIRKETGLLIKAQETGRNGIYINAPNWSNYTVEMKAEKQAGSDGFYLGVGLINPVLSDRTLLEYTVGTIEKNTGIKVYKEGKEAYTMGDYSSSTCAGNLRAAYIEEAEIGKEYSITVNYGGETGNHLICFYEADGRKSTVLNYKLEAYNRDIYHSVTKDESNIYAKLVNADSIDKLVKIILKNEEVKEEFDLITLSGEKEQLQVPNINKKDKEQIVPIKNKAKIKEGILLLNLPANSATIAVFKRK